MARTSEAIRTYPRVKRVVGGALALVAIVSLVISILGVYQVWSLRGRVSRSVDGGLTLLSSTLTTSDRALKDADDQLVVAQESLLSAEKAARNVAGMMGGTRDSLKTSSVIVSSELPATILATQTSIENAQSSAQLIDNVLATLASIPFLGVDYRPAVPLSEQLGNMARSLDRLPGLTADLGRQIDDTAISLDDAQAETTTLAETLHKSQAGFAESRDAVSEFRRQVAQAQDLVAKAQKEAPTAINWVAVALTFALAWLVLVQIAALALGLDWLLAGGGTGERD
jgi:hypothetical protein